jgi:hypothetical protein
MARSEGLKPVYTRCVSKKKGLRVAKSGDQKLGRATIMDRALAQRHGAPYVHLAAFAIDVDRVHRLDFDRPSQPFAWEVFLTEMRLVRFMDEATSDPTQMLEDMCLSVMDLPHPEPDSQGVLGAQLPFAIYAGVAHDHLPNSLGSCFQVWKKPPTDLLSELEALAARDKLVAKLSAHCLAASLDPPLAEPVRAALLAMQEERD